MIFFNKITLNNFRNFHFFENDFSKNCNVIYGNNGTGKTNLLESISLFDKGTGIRNDHLLNLIKFKKDNFSIFGECNYINENYEIKVFSENKNEKLVKRILINNDNNKESLKHIRSLLSFIIFQPEMERLFLLSPSYRRKFIDRLIYAYNNNYNVLLNKYKKNLLERSNLLKSNSIDENWISNIENNIALIGNEIYGFRNSQVKILNYNIKKLFENNKSPYLIQLKIVDKLIQENPSILNDVEQYKTILKKNRKIDSLLGGAFYGPHKSDISGFVKDNFALNQLSTGQQKTVVLLLILAQCEYLVNERKIFPIVLMDEICSHLDETNRSILLTLLEAFNLQFFMTGTDKSLFAFLSTNVEYYNISG